jgi:hypothetical protein
VDKAFEEELLKVAMPSQENNSTATVTTACANDEFDACLDAAISSNPNLFP